MSRYEFIEISSAVHFVARCVTRQESVDYPNDSRDTVVRKTVCFRITELIPLYYYQRCYHITKHRLNKKCSVVLKNLRIRYNKRLKNLRFSYAEASQSVYERLDGVFFSGRVFDPGRSQLVFQTDERQYIIMRPISSCRLDDRMHGVWPECKQAAA